MIPALCVPILNRGDFLLRLIKSIDYPVDTLHVLVNYTKAGPESSVAEAIKNLATNAFIKNVVIDFGALYSSAGEVVSHNMGVSGSWNKFIKQHESLSYIMLVGNDIQFTPGDLEKFDTYIATLKNRNNKGVICGNQGYSCFVILPETVSTVGYFDENIYPAYLEDCDYSKRCHLSNMDCSGVDDTHMIHGEAPTWGSSTIYGNEAYRKKNGTTHGMNFRYYIEKWGNVNGRELFVYPFNKEENSVKYWPEVTERIFWE